MGRNFRFFANIFVPRLFPMKIFLVVSLTLLLHIDSELFIHRQRRQVGGVVEARTRCARVTGRVFCPTDHDRHFGVPVALKDRDALPWETDDLMGVNETDAEGNFSIEGCADDLGLWNDPDPYVQVMHRCPEPGHSISIVRRHHVFPIEHKFLPDEDVNLGELRIDLPCTLC